MKAPTTSSVREYFHNVGAVQGALWIPTKTRNEFIAEEEFSTQPKMTVHGRIYRIHFDSIGGGMWEITLRSLDGKKLVDNLAS